MPDEALPPDSLVGRMLNPLKDETGSGDVIFVAEPEPPPLLRAMSIASGQLLDATFGDATRLQCWAAEIKALRDWLPMVPPDDLIAQWEEEESFTTSQVIRRSMEWLRDQLTEQARIAKGD